MVVVTHEMGFAREVADQLVFMDGGVIVESGDPREVLSNPQQERTQAVPVEGDVARECRYLRPASASATAAAVGGRFSAGARHACTSSPRRP